ncbi:RDD family protein [Pseudonocardia sp. TRM90224]|uniref:RDD family protein n=1 Tax=Pseudonocardia sp. TRM90224 TaxID=2812678 RepID=UPI001E4E15B4|nr:RDD family protein [Pseudonocardia sp. TRM90224]
MSMPPPWPTPGQPGNHHPGFPQPGQVPPLAEWWERLVARIIDSAIFLVVNAIISAIVFAVFGLLFATAGFGFYSTFSLVTLISWLLIGLVCGGYDFFMHARFGQTLGKMALNLRITTIDGRPLSQQTLLRRAALYPGSFAVVGLLAGFSWSAATLGILLVIGWSIADGVTVLTDERTRQALHDRFAGTVVVKTPPR